MENSDSINMMVMMMRVMPETVMIEDDRDCNDDGGDKSVGEDIYDDDDHNREMIMLMMVFRVFMSDENAGHDKDGHDDDNDDLGVNMIIMTVTVIILLVRMIMMMLKTVKMTMRVMMIETWMVDDNDSNCDSGEYINDNHVDKNDDGDNYVGFDDDEKKIL